MSRLPVVRRMVLHQPLRAAAAALVIGAATTLMLFMDGVTHGVLDGTAAYVGQDDVDLWIARRGTENLIRSSSFLPAALGADLAADPAVAVASPLLRVFVRAEAGDRRLTLLALGIGDPPALGGPHLLADGSGHPGPDGVLLDRGAAHLLAVGIGDSVAINGERHVVRGLSTGTNLLATQIAFLRLERLAVLSGSGAYVSFYLVRLREPADASAFRMRWDGRGDDLAVYGRERFAASSLDEVHAGFRPILTSFAFQGALVAAAVITLVLYGRVMERRAGLAVLLALGARPAYLVRLVLAQALVLAAAGVGLALLATGAIGLAVDRWVPQLAFAFASESMLRSGGVVFAAAVLGAAFPLARLRRIDPAEVFRA